MTLTPTPATGSTFAGWSGACTGTGACSVPMSAARAVTATFNPVPTYTLTVSKTGTGTGTVTSSPAGISCGADCSQAYASSTVVALTAAASTGSTFTGWSGACTGTGPCSVTMSAAKTATANFSMSPPTTGAAPVVWTAVVGATASGSSLTKTAGTGWGNSGAVSSQEIASGDGFVEVTATDTVTHVAMFGLSKGNADAGYADIDFGLYQRYGQLQVFEKGVGVFVSGEAYSVGDKLRVAVVGGVVQYLRNGAVFYTSSQAPTYPLLLDAAIYTQGSTLGNASFGTGSGGGVPTSYSLTVSRAGTGTGTVISSPSGINCGATCSASYSSGAIVGLTATPASGSTFAGWSGACTGTGACSVTMSAAKTATANFSMSPPTTGAAPVVWTAVVGATASGSSLTKTAGTGWGNSGAVSSQEIASGDGFVEVTATDTVTQVAMFGLSKGNADAGYADIDFGLYQRYGQLQVYEKGVAVLVSGGAYSVGDKLRVAVVGGVVQYLRNGAVFYTSSQAPTYPLLLDAAIYTQGSTLGSATISVP